MNSKYEAFLKNNKIELLQFTDSKKAPSLSLNDPLRLNEVNFLKPIAER